MKRVVSLMLLMLNSIMLLIPGKYAYAQELDLESASVVLMEAATGEILFEKEMDTQRTPASVTKLMTLLVAWEAIEAGNIKTDSIVIASEQASSLGGSQIYLETGEEMTLQDLLVAIAVGSANDACVAVAEYLYGSEEAFVQAMNDKAAELGMKNTHFYNPYGLPNENHYTSAHDLALLGQAALQDENIMKLTAIKHYTLRTESMKPFELHNTNKLLWWYPGADGFKTGWVGRESGYCLASTAQREELRLIAVVLGAQERYGNFRDAMKLFNYGFANYQFVSLFAAGEKVGTATIEKGQSDQIDFGTKRLVGRVQAKNNSEEMTTQYHIEHLEAPIQKGDKIGSLDVLSEGKVVETYDLVALNDVEKCSFWQQMKKVCLYVFC